MLNRRFNCTLMDAEHPMAKMVLHPTGELEVDVAERRQHFSVDIDHVLFRRSEQSMELVCEETAGVPFCLALSAQDAFALYHLMEDSREELEELMSDL
ncbi:hypothetical protein MBH78_08315 [Oceanimonas sp. NS1]|uniref:Uncharacterized protein n=1 Tax=Oceanimonas doudoroffii TaxID=84158 RepID=A0A233RDN1_9GAMM|nr:MULTISPECIES: hypothetical protein [Oceanimonas]MCT7654769.1 hypothetical protein [Oceanimonas sp. NS1]NHH99035.1 hypothetical protein [Oceanimonas sp. MB9]OXY81496.1 hypothetical protein B6S08_10990 [Oceanimonas doudoroffii]